MLQDADQAKAKHPPTDRTAGNADELQCRTYLSGMIGMLITEIAHTRLHGILTIKLTRAEGFPLVRQGQRTATTPVHRHNGTLHPRR